MATTPARKATKAAAKKVTAKKVTAKQAAPGKKVTAKQAAPGKKAAAKKASAKATAPAPAKAPAKAKAAATKANARPSAPPAKRAARGIRVSSNFDATFLQGQRAALLEERASLLGQAERLEDEAAALMEDQQTGDVQFDDESGEGDSLAVERERDLALSAQARQMVADIDAALARITDGTYGYSVVSGRPIPKERLRAIPWATELVEEKVGGLGRR